MEFFARMQRFTKMEECRGQQLKSREVYIVGWVSRGYKSGLTEYNMGGDSYKASARKDHAFLVKRQQNFHYTSQEKS